MTVCAHCGRKVWTERLLEHWRMFCPDTERPIGHARLAEAIAQPEPPLLERVWEQIEDIFVETGFVR